MYRTVPHVRTLLYGTVPYSVRYNTGTLVRYWHKDYLSPMHRLLPFHFNDLKILESLDRQSSLIRQNYCFFSRALPKCRFALFFIRSYVQKELCRRLSVKCPSYLFLLDRNIWCADKRSFSIRKHVALFMTDGFGPYLPRRRNSA